MFVGSLILRQKRNEKLSKEIIRVIAPDQLISEFPDYEDLADLARSFIHQVVLCKEGDHEVLRWKENSLVGHLIGDTGGCEFYTPPEWNGAMHNQTHRGSVSLNGLIIDLFRRKFTLEDYMKFYMGIGYSLSGFIEVFGQQEVTDYGVQYFEQPPEGFDFDNKYWETPINYMRKKHKGKIAI